MQEQQKPGIGADRILPSSGKIGCSCSLYPNPGKKSIGDFGWICGRKALQKRSHAIFDPFFPSSRARHNNTDRTCIPCTPSSFRLVAEPRSPCAAAFPVRQHHPSRMRRRGRCCSRRRASFHPGTRSNAFRPACRESSAKTFTALASENKQ